MPVEHGEIEITIGKKEREGNVTVKQFVIQLREKGTRKVYARKTSETNLVVQMCKFEVVYPIEGKREYFHVDCTYSVVSSLDYRCIGNLGKERNVEFLVELTICQLLEITTSSQCYFPHSRLTDNNQCQTIQEVDIVSHSHVTFPLLITS